MGGEWWEGATGKQYDTRGAKCVCGVGGGLVRTRAARGGSGGAAVPWVAGVRWVGMGVGGCGVGRGEGRACQPVMEKVLPAEETVIVRSNIPGSAAKCWCGSPA